MVVTCRLPIFLNMYRLRLAQKIKIVYVPVAFSKHSFSITKSLASIQKIVLEFSQTESLEKSYLTEICVNAFLNALTAPKQNFFSFIGMVHNTSWKMLKKSPKNNPRKSLLFHYFKGVQDNVY